MAASCQTGGGPMIRLSDVKVRLQYRWRVRQRLMVLQFAQLQGGRRRQGADLVSALEQFAAGGPGGGWKLCRDSCLAIRATADVGSPRGSSSSSGKRGES